ncbi:MAG TPA: hypothetical protein VGO78_19945 [Acidimicrobiales bacterium]|jgi:hypothetical protein|nr:hypothetical protein [Acidimicrobiales bacterium]
MAIRRKPSALVASLAIVAGLLAAGTPASGAPEASDAAAAAGSTLDRPDDAVVLTGAQLTELVGTAPNRVVGFRASSGAWAQIPVQVDERKDTTNAAIYNLPTTQTFYNSTINIPVKAYTDPNTFTGADGNTAFDADDEVAFMTRDAGGARGTLAAPAGTTGQPVEVRLNEPGNAAATGYVYLFASNGTLNPAAGKANIGYDFRLTSGDYRTTYKRTDGPNPENSTVTGSTYTAHFSDRWLMDGISLTRGSKPGVDLIDRAKYDIQAFCVRNENTFDDEEGAFVVNKAGPIRAIRSYIGSNSGPNTQNTHFFYDTFVDTHVELKVHAIPNVEAHLDFNQQAYGMTYRNPQVPNGVPVDGQADNVPASAGPTWWSLVGPQGGFGLSAIYATDASAQPVTYYEDNTTPTNWQCTGDSQAVGDSGVFFNSWIDCTDPGVSCNQKLSSTFRVVATPSTVTPADVQKRAEALLKPLVVTVNGRGGSPPPGGTCVRALNSDHVTAGRATAFLWFVSAVGSNQSIGFTWDTTSLREVSPGRWETVAAC